MSFGGVPPLVALLGSGERVEPHTPPACAVKALSELAKLHDGRAQVRTTVLRTIL